MNVYKNYKLERRRKAIIFFVGTYFLIFSVKQNKKKKNGRYRQACMITNRQIPGKDIFNSDLIVFQIKK